MPGVDWIPGISQLKSAIQLVAGDAEGAAKTMENFLKECPVVSQVTSIVQVASGDVDGAIETQKCCLGTINNVANGIPVVGHVKGVVHYIAGDEEGGNQALNSATRSTVVIASGAAAGIATGGIGAIPAGIAAGVSYDVTATVVTDKPQGYVAAIDNVIQNPSSGNIFDTVALPVGDGLAGYSGGQLANKINTQIKLNKLQSAMEAKLELLESGRDGGMNSGQLHALGAEINALHSEINVIRHGTPQYWYDPKSKEIVITRTTPNNSVIPVIGYSKDYQKQENALLADSYIESVLIQAKNVNDSIKILHQKKNQNIDNDTLKEIYRNVGVLSNNQLNNLKKEFNKNDPNKKLEKAFTGNSWLHIQMPQQFNYTGAIMINNPFQGLLHSFLRHGQEWVSFIPNLNNGTEYISKLQKYLDAIRSANTPELSQNAVNEFLNVRKSLSDEDLRGLESNLTEAQLNIHEFIQNNITYQNYLGEGANTLGRQQVFFKVHDARGNTHVMVVCVSDQLYPSDSDFGDSRPIRTITTVFFISWNSYLRRHLIKCF